MYIKSKETCQTSYELTRVIYKFIPTFGKLMDLARYQAKSSNKLVNHSCQFMYS